MVTRLGEVYWSSLATAEQQPHQTLITVIVEVASCLIGWFKSCLHCTSSCTNFIQVNNSQQHSRGTCNEYQTKAMSDRFRLERRTCDVCDKVFKYPSDLKKRRKVSSQLDRSYLAFFKLSNLFPLSINHVWQPSKNSKWKIAIRRSYYSHLRTVTSLFQKQQIQYM